MVEMSCGYVDRDVCPCAVGLLPFLINNLRNPSHPCKAAALHLVTMTLSAQTKPSHIEAAYLLDPEVQDAVANSEMHSNGVKAQIFIDQTFVALQSLLHSKLEGDQPLLANCFCFLSCRIFCLLANWTMLGLHSICNLSCFVVLNQA